MSAIALVVLGLLGASRKLLYALCVPFVVLVVLESGVRVWGYSERQIYDPIYMPFAGTAEIHYVHKPNLTNARARGLAIVNTDSFGLRSKVAGVRYGARHDREYRIAVVGDSVTFGEGVKRTEETYPQVLEDVLNQKQNGRKSRSSTTALRRTASRRWRPHSTAGCSRSNPIWF